MAITSTQQTEILKIVAGLFNAAPGGTNLSDLANAVSGGMTTKQLANVLASNTLFTNGIMAGKVTTDAQAAVLMNNFGLVADSTTTSAGSQALAYFKSQIDAKVGFGDIVYNAVTFLSGSSVPPEFTAAATLLANKALVGAEYSATNSSSSLSTLQSVVSQVKGDKDYTAADVTAALASVGDTVAPTVTAPAAAIEYNENQAAGATLATIAATDNVGVASFQIASGDTSGFFAIDSTGKISLTDAGLKSSANDFETTPNTVTLGIAATDGAGNKSTPVNVILNVKDVDDVAPTFKSAVVNGTTANLSFSEALSTTAAAPSVSDFTVGIKGGSGSISISALKVTGSSVELTLGRAPATGETFTVAYTAGTNALKDVAGNKAATFTAQDIVVDTTAPTVTAGQTFTFVEAVSDGKGGLTGPVTKTTDVIGTVAATDNTGVTSFAIASGNDKGWFAIDSVGKLTLTTAGLTAASNDFETTPNSFSLGITAKDGAGNASTAGTVTVSVTNNTVDDAAAGQTFVLTTGIDLIPGTNVNTGNDTIIGDFTATATLNAGDQINGGIGTDTLKMFGTYAAANMPVTVTGIENLEVATLAAAAIDLSALTKAATGIEKIIIGNASAMNNTITTGASQSLSLSTGASNTHTAGAVTWAGSATDVSQSLTLNGYQGSASAVPVALTVQGAEVTTLNLALTGAANAVTTFTLGAKTNKVVVTGDQNLTVSTSLVSSGGATILKTVDASGASGAVAITLAAATNSAFAFTGGSGNDSIKFADDGLAVANLVSGSQLDGGAGTADKIGILDTALTTAEYAAINAAKNFEVLGINAAVTVAADSLTSIKQFSLDTNAAQSITNMAASSTVSVTAAHAAAITLGGAVGSSSVTFNVGTATTTGITLGGNVTIGQQTVALTSNGTNAAANTITALLNADNSSYTITGSNDLTITTTQATATGSKYDGSLATGKLNITGNTTAYSAGSALGDVFVGGSAADTFKASVNGATITGNAGADTFNVEATPAGATSSAAITRITDFTKGDKIDFAATAGAFTAAKVDLSGAASEQAAIDLLVAGSNTDLKWGNYNGFTYIADDAATNATMQATDTVVKLTGTLDLSTSTLAATVLTFA